MDDFVLVRKADAGTSRSVLIFIYYFFHCFYCLLGHIDSKYDNFLIQDVRMTTFYSFFIYNNHFSTTETHQSYSFIKYYYCWFLCMVKMFQIDCTFILLQR